MSRRIIVPVDESPRSERALPVAAQIARRMGASLVLVSVVEWPNSEHPGHPGYHESLMANYPDLEAESVVIKTLEDVHEAIASIVETDDLVCLAADHTSTFGEILLTSVFFSLLRRLRCPVIAVGPHAHLPESATQMLLCVDGGHHAEQGLALIPRFAKPAGYRPFLIEVVERDPHEPAPPRDTAEVGYLHDLAGRITKMGVGDVGYDVLHGRTRDAIASYADDPDFAVLAFVTDALEPLPRLFTHSLANDLLRSSPRPLVLLRAEHSHAVTRHLIPKAEV